MSLELRIIEPGKKNGAFNTALDMALLELVGNNESKPTIVLSDWEPTVSLGNSQNYFLDADEEACRRRGVQIVRRKSGGQAVFLDDNYFVFSVIAKPNMFPKDLTILRKWFCNLVIEMLTDYNIPAEFYQPDNIVIKDGNRFRTLGNSGQIITNKAIVVHGSIRYSLKNLDIMTDVLKVNGQKLHQFKDEIENILADVERYKCKIDLKQAFLDHFSSKYQANFLRGELSLTEKNKTNKIADDLIKNVSGEINYKSRGVCYFFLNGQNLVPSLQKFLPENKPSEWLDSVIQLEESVNGI